MKTDAGHRVLSLLQGILVGLYGTLKKAGFLKFRWSRNLFQSSYFAYKKHLEDPFWRLTQKWPALFKEGAALDIGANIGYNSYVFAKAIDPGHQVFAFEPDPTNFSQLKEVIQRYGLADRVVPVRSAVGDTNGEIDFWHNRNHHAYHRIFTRAFEQSVEDRSTVFRVPICSVDQYLASRDSATKVRFIKIDVQGFELPVCEGMTRTLDANPQAVLAIEYEPVALAALGFESRKLLDFLGSRFDHLYILSRKGDLRRTDARTVEQMTRERVSVDLLCSRQDLEHHPSIGESDP